MVERPSAQFLYLGHSKDLTIIYVPVDNQAYQ